MIRALILDLDDTIFPTASIDPVIVKPFFDALEEYNDVLQPEVFEKAKQDLWKRPFYVVASEYGFSANMTQKSLEVLNGLDFNLRIKTYPDYYFLKSVDTEKFLVTTGFKRLQEAKIGALDIGGYFREILIDDPSVKSGGKTLAFQQIMEKYGYLPAELLVIGDNPDSEIVAARNLGIHSLLINRRVEAPAGREVIGSFKELPLILEKMKAGGYKNNAERL